MGKRQRDQEGSSPSMKSFDSARGSCVPPSHHLSSAQHLRNASGPSASQRRLQAPFSLSARGELCMGEHVKANLMDFVALS